jgi:CheY-like chemotaxis protein
VSHTGDAGFTLGGGFGRVARRFGLSLDNVRAVEVVTANGELVRASADENPDLFWGVRGGGGNFGVVTRFEFRLHPVGPMGDFGLLFWPINQSRDVLRPAGFEVHQAHDAPTAIVYARMHRPAVILIDAEIPGQDGVEMCRQLKRDPELGGAAIIVLARSADPALKMQALAAGANDFLLKPFEPRDLLMRVNAAVRNRRPAAPAESAAPSPRGAPEPVAPTHNLRPPPAPADPHARSSNATASAPRPSPRPVNPSPSVVAARPVTRPSSPPSAIATACPIA